MLRDSRLSNDYGVVVVGIMRPNGDVIYAPTGDAILEVGATLIAFGKRAQLALAEMLVKSGEDLAHPHEHQ